MICKTGACPACKKTYVLNGGVVMLCCCEMVKAPKRRAVLQTREVENG